MVSLTGRRCVVIGSAPLARPLTVAEDEIIVAVNGGIGSYPLCDVWVLNSRNVSAESWSPAQRRLSLAFLKQGANQRVPQAVFLTKHEDAEKWTLAFLRSQGTNVFGSIAIHNEARRAIETAVGARSGEMSKQALSAGLFAACWCFHAGADQVRLEGFSWSPGYAYLPGEVFIHRGHTAGDKQALARLTSKYGERLIYHFTKENDMVTKKKKGPLSATAQRAPAKQAAQASARSRTRAAREALLPKAERARLKREAEAKASAKPARSRQRIVRATELTFYNNKRRRVGETFALRDPLDFRPSCMEDVDPDAPAQPAAVARTRERTPQLAADGVTPIEEPVSPTGRADADNPLGIA